MPTCLPVWSPQCAAVRTMSGAIRVPPHSPRDAVWKKRLRILDEFADCRCRKRIPKRAFSLLTIVWICVSIGVNLVPTDDLFLEITAHDVVFWSGQRMLLHINNYWVGFDRRGQTGERGHRDKDGWCWWVHCILMLCLMRLFCNLADLNLCGVCLLVSTFLFHLRCLNKFEKNHVTLNTGTLRRKAQRFRSFNVNRYWRAFSGQKSPYQIAYIYLWFNDSFICIPIYSWEYTIPSVEYNPIETDITNRAWSYSVL